METNGIHMLKKINFQIFGKLIYKFYKQMIGYKKESDEKEKTWTLLYYNANIYILL